MNNPILWICVVLGVLFLFSDQIRSLLKWRPKSRPATPDECDLEGLIREYLNDLDVEEGHRRALMGQLTMVLSHHSRRTIEELIDDVNTNQE